jgi:hypothetical protein
MGWVLQNVARVLATIVLIACGGALLQIQAAEGTCKKEDFESAVETAAASLRDINSKNRPEFQEKLRELKDKRKWNHDEFVANATPFVRDDKTAVYDKTTNELLSAISSMGQQGSGPEAPDCAVLLELRARMKMLVDTQVAKWSYMFGKLDAELAK